LNRPVLLDSSALLAVILRETGAEAVEARVGSAQISAVNSAEVIGKLVDKGLSPDAAETVFEACLIPVEPFAASTAAMAGRLRAETRAHGLSLGDRACLAQARIGGFVALTADRAWAELDIGIEIEVIR